MNFCILLLCISTSGIYLKTGTNKKEAIFYSLRDLYLEQKKNPSINNQNKITPLETEFKALLYEDFLEVREDWEVEKKVHFLGAPPKTLPPSVLLLLENLGKYPDKATKFSNFKDSEAHIRSLIIFDLDSQLQTNPELFGASYKTSKKKKEVTSGTSLNGFLLLLLLPIIYFIFKKKNLSKE